jgi:hypothetical protein
MNALLRCSRRVIRISMLLLLQTAAFSADYEYLFNTTFSGTSPAGTNTWIEVMFHDLGAGKVSLTISNSGLTDSEFISGLYFNLNTNLGPTQLTFQLTGGNDPSGASTISTGVNQFKADGDGLYDILFSFPTTTDGRFGVGDYLVYEASGIPTITALDFDFVSAPAGGSGPFLAAAHVQSIGSAGASGWIRPTEFQAVTVPEAQPASLILLGAVLWCMLRVTYRQSSVSSAHELPAQGRARCPPCGWDR